MTYEQGLREARRIIRSARIKGQGDIEFNPMLHDLMCTFTRDGDAITLVVELQDMRDVYCYQYSPSRWRRPPEQQAFLAFSRQIRSLQCTLERRLNLPKLVREDDHRLAPSHANLSLLTSDYSFTQIVVASP